MAPAAKSIGYLYNPNYSAAMEEPSIKALEIAARTLGLRVVTAKATSPNEIDQAFAMLVGEGVGAVIIGSLIEWTNQIIALAARHKLPAMYSYPRLGSRSLVEAGGLMSYGGIGQDAIHLAGTYVGRILKGENPADLPVQQSTKTELAINMKTARVLGLNVPLTLQTSADEVIE
jgi:putative ABC transport system substrate-binding protein